MKVLNIIIFFLLFFICFSCEQSKNITDTGNKTDNMAAPLVQELDSLIYPLQSASPDYTGDDLEPLSYLGESKIVGLGEATHGTKEFFQIKHRIFKYLVEEHGFKIFGFECDMGESYYIDKYITEGEGNIDDLMINIMHFWTWRTEEVKALLEWMKSYNTGRSEGEKIHFIGVDCQFMTYQPDLLEDYFTRVKPEFLPELTPTLTLIKDMGYKSSASVRAYYEAMDEEEYTAISDSLVMILSLVEEIGEELKTNSSNFEYQFMKQLVRNLQQVNDNKYKLYHENEYSARDEYMAENALWLTTLLGGNKGIALWAHNGHIENSNNSIENLGIIKSMGSFLKSEIGFEYQIVGFSFSRGSFTAVGYNPAYGYTGLEQHTIDTEPIKNSVNYYFSKAKYDNFIFCFKDVPSGSVLDDWISEPNSILHIGSVFNGNPRFYYSIVKLSTYYDVLIHYDSTTAAVQLSYDVVNKLLCRPDF